MISQYPKVLIVLIAILSLTSLDGIAQYDNLTFKHFSSREGLTNNFVWDLHQDRYGYIWVGGLSGLNKFDGYTFTSFRNQAEDTTSLRSGVVLDVEEDLNGDILIGLSTGFSIYSYEHDHFYNINLPDSIPSFELVRDIYVENDNSYWLATLKGIYNLSKKSGQNYDFEYRFYPKQNFNEEFSRVTSIQPKDDQFLWLGSDEGLYEFNMVDHTYTKFIPSDTTVANALENEIWTMHTDQNNHLWFATLSGLIQWEQGSDQPKWISTLGNSLFDLRGQPIQSITENAEGKLYFGISGDIGAMIFDPETNETTLFERKSGEPNSMQENDGHYFFEDIDGNLWFGYHTNGMSIAFDQSWRYDLNRLTDSTEPGLPEHDIHQIVEDESGDLWFATHLGLIQTTEGEEGFKNYLPNPNVSPSHVDNQISSLVSFENKFLTYSHSRNFNVFDRQKQEFESIKANFQVTTTILQNSIDGKFYFGSLSNKISQLSASDLKVTEITVPLVDSLDFTTNGTFILESNDQSIYAAYVRLLTNGVKFDFYLLDSDINEFEHLPINLPLDIFAFGMPIPSRTQSNIIWYPTSSGLYRIDTSSFQMDLLFQSDASIFTDLSQESLYEDSEGYLWLPSQLGLIKLDPITQTLTYLQSRPDYGLQVFRTPTQLSTGEFVAPGIGGYLRFDANNQVLVADINNIHVTDIRAGSTVFKTLTKPDPVSISHSENNITFSYLALNYSNPQVTRYRYRIVGYNDNWVEVGSQRMVFLANLPPGNYTFEVQAAQQYGTFGDITATQQFIVLPPWWRTIPAYILFALIFGGSIFAVDRFQRKRLLTQERERTREKELEQAQKIKVAYVNLEVAHENLKSAQTQLVQQEKLASLGQLTAGIAHEIKNPLNFVNNFSSVSVEMLDDAILDLKSLKKDLQKADINADALLKTTDETLHVLNDVRINLSKIHDHGTRADGIVKSMLLHSRGGSGKRESTDFNFVVKEYVNLAYHGMRASKNPISVDIEMNLGEYVGEFSMISEDFSRVVLNLCNNAFDALRDKINAQTDDPKSKLSESVAFKPVLKVRTSRNGKTVLLEIEDNGPGIPDDIRDKILQPFFTTKKGTMGTGLGLSITHDIIKAHGGELYIESEPGKTVFSITLS
ncbi:MAG TPA: hypothetical protein DCE78_07930 [Bacteroidetes bacterium]|nr:hypothetical protein [Bacteroidota bacterium]